jgi:O-antigen/teichoic acid export membrane protein
MSAAAKAISFRRLTRRAFSIGAIKVTDKAMQFLLPVVLTRCLDSATFGEYRLLWLVVGSVMALGLLSMSSGLNYFLPRSDAPRRRLYVHQAMLFFAAAGLVFAALAGPWNPFLPQAIAPLAKYDALVPLFLGLWVAAALLDHLPTIDERVRWQAWATVGTSLLRVALVAAGALASGELELIIALLIAAVVAKLALLALYVRRYHGLGSPWFEWRAFAAQVRQAAPFGLAGALYNLRGQADLWVAAALFSLSSFAAFSIAAVLKPLLGLFRRSMVEAFIPSMSRLEAAGDVAGMMQLNSRANVLVGAAIYPLLAFVFAFAEEIVTVVYTAAYLEAAPAMRIYLVGMAVMVLEVWTVVFLLRQGKASVGINAAALVVSGLVSWGAASTIGLAGAALGSVVAVCLDRTLMLRRIAAQVGIPVRKLQDWRGLGLALGYAIASAALIRALVDLAVPEGALARLALGACGLAVVYLPILSRWRKQ